MGHDFLDPQQPLTSVWGGLFSRQPASAGLLT
jgi:hypothetical protein